MQETYNIIVIRIKEFMKSADIAQKELAEATNISESEITRILRQQNSKISHKTILALCDYFNVSADYLLGRTDNKDMIERL